MTMKAMCSAYRGQQAGFGIIEIMIALALGVIIMLGVTQIATNSSSTRYELDRAGRQLENATYALHEMDNDLTNAGFWGELGEQTTEIDAINAAFPGGDDCDDDVPTNSAEVTALGNVPVCPGAAADACAARVELVRSTLFPVDGADEDGDSCVTPKVGTGFLAVRRANSCALGDANCGAAANNFHLQVNSCFNTSNDAYPLPGINFRIDSNLDNLNYLIRLDPCPALVAYTPPADLTERAPIYRFLSRVYFVNDDDQLVRSELVGTEYVENILVEGVEMMRVEYGLDNDGDGQVDAYSNAPVGNEWGDVTMVRISLVVRSTEPSNGYLDEKTYTVAGESYTVPADFQNYRRQVYTRTASLRNIAGRREVP